MRPRTTPSAPGAGGPFARVVRVARTGSTNVDLVAALRLPGADADWPHLSVLLADHQTHGRGRGRREWETPPGSSLTASIVVRPAVPLATWSWLGLLAGWATVRAVRTTTGLPVALKWPNDVVVLGAGPSEQPGWGTDRKVAGVLVEAVPGGSDGAGAAVVGVGVNLHQRAPELPVPWATSLAEAGVPRPARDPAALLQALGEELRRLLEDWVGEGGDAEAAGLRAAVAMGCVTLGREVRVTMPGGAEARGRAVGIASDGALVLEGDDGARARVTAGDVDHVRLRTG